LNLLKKGVACQGKSRKNVSSNMTSSINFIQIDIGGLNGELFSLGHCIPKKDIRIAESKKMAAG
jgi:hypothetical protein